MDDPLNMSLDDIIQKNKQYSKGQNRNFVDVRHRGLGRRRPAGHVYAYGPARRLGERGPTTRTPYSSSHGSDGQTIRTRKVAGTKLYVSNLHYEVSDDDIKVLFSDVGELKKYGIHYDESGRSKGTAEVVFAKQTDALAAIKRYNLMQLDGRPLKIHFIGDVEFLAPRKSPTDGMWRRYSKGQRKQLQIIYLLVCKIFRQSQYARKNLGETVWELVVIQVHISTKMKKLTEEFSHE